jgi:hypothetical protein
MAMKIGASPLAVAVAATVGAGGAEAATYVAVLTNVGQYSNSGLSAGNITSSTATFTYDDVAGLLTQAGGMVNVRFTTAPTATLFRHMVTGLVIGGGSAATATTFQCIEGNFGGNVGASICGNYGFGANFANESTSSWGPGTAYSRTIVGDDLAAGPQQNIGFYDGFNQVSWIGTSLVLSNATCTGICATLPAGSFNSGYRWELTAGPQTVPIPAAAWLFGGALPLLGALRRRTGASA